MYNFWWSVGGFFASIALQSLNSRRPDDFRIAIYTQVRTVKDRSVVSLARGEIADARLYFISGPRSG